MENGSSSSSSTIVPFAKEVKAKLLQHDIAIQTTWLEKCLVWLTTQYSGPVPTTLSKVYDLVYNCFLSSDLSITLDKTQVYSFKQPATFNVMTKHSVIKGPLLLQINEIRKVSKPAKSKWKDTTEIEDEEYQKMREDLEASKNPGKVNSGRGKNKSSGSSRDPEFYSGDSSKYRTLKFAITDGFSNSLYAVEVTRIDLLSTKTPPGIKIKLRNVIVKHGIMFISPSNVIQILGGSVAELVEANNKLINANKDDETNSSSSSSSSSSSTSSISSSSSSSSSSISTPMSSSANNLRNILNLANNVSNNTNSNNNLRQNLTNVNKNNPSTQTNQISTSNQSATINNNQINAYNNISSNTINQSGNNLNITPNTSTSNNTSSSSSSSSSNPPVVRKRIQLSLNKTPANPPPQQNSTANLDLSKYRPIKSEPAKSPPSSSIDLSSSSQDKSSLSTLPLPLLETPNSSSSDLTQFAPQKKLPETTTNNSTNTNTNNPPKISVNSPSKSSEEERKESPDLRSDHEGEEEQNTEKQQQQQQQQHPEFELDEDLYNQHSSSTVNNYLTQQTQQDGNFNLGSELEDYFMEFDEDSNNNNNQNFIEEFDNSTPFNYICDLDLDEMQSWDKDKTVALLASSTGILKNSFTFNSGLGKYTLSLHFDDGTGTVVGALSAKLVKELVGIEQREFVEKLKEPGGKGKEDCKKRVAEMEKKVFGIDGLVWIKYREKWWPKLKVWKIDVQSLGKNEITTLLDRMKKNRTIV